MQPHYLTWVGLSRKLVYFSTEDLILYKGGALEAGLLLYEAIHKRRDPQPDDYVGSPAVAVWRPKKDQGSGGAHGAGGNKPSGSPLY